MKQTVIEIRNWVEYGYQVKVYRVIVKKSGERMYVLEICKGIGGKLVVDLSFKYEETVNIFLQGFFAGVKASKK